MPAPAARDVAPPPVLPDPCRTLLTLLESARDRLARRLLQEDPAIADPDLNARLFSTVLEVLFLKTGQECGFTGPDTLALLAGSDGIGRRMARACSDAGLVPETFFEQGPAGRQPATVVPDDALREFIREIDAAGIPVPPAALLPEDCAALFDVFAGMRLQVAEGYRVTKAGKSAVLYTGSVDIPPRQVVAAMVNGTLPPALRNMHAGADRPVRILDPACGAGIVLLAAYRFLAGQGSDPASVLSVSVFGTDIDPESVSAARFVLLLAFIGDAQKRGPGPVRPDEIRKAAESLSRTIRCGNALVAPDYFSGRQVHPFNAGERQRVNAFSWQAAFPEIISGGGFDAIIGAPPPYRPLSVPSREEYFQTHYAAYGQGAGLYVYFAERALSLARPGGRVTFLVPATFLRSDSARPFRRLLLTRRILQVTDTGHDRTLQDGPARMYLLSLANEPPGESSEVRWLDGSRGFTIGQRRLTDGGWILADRRAEGIAERLMAGGMPLERYVMGEIGTGPEDGMPAIVAAEYSPVPFFRYDRNGSSEPENPVISIRQDDPYLAGILNSSLGRFLIARICPLTDRGYHLTPSGLGRFPVIVPDFDRLADRARHARMVALVMQVFSLQEYLQKAKTDQEKRLVQQEIDATGVKIDALVYGLYGLSEEEIAVIEGTAGK